MPPQIRRRHFLKLMGSAASLTQIPGVAQAASRPPLALTFPQDPLITWYDPTYGLVKPDGRRHLGIDLMAPKLSPVYAIGDGTSYCNRQEPQGRAIPDRRTQRRVAELVPPSQQRCPP